MGSDIAASHPSQHRGQAHIGQLHARLASFEHQLAAPR